MAAPHGGVVGLAVEGKGVVVKIIRYRKIHRDIRLLHCKMFSKLWLPGVDYKKIGQLQLILHDNGVGVTVFGVLYEHHPVVGGEIGATGHHIAHVFEGHFFLLLPLSRKEPDRCRPQLSKLVVELIEIAVFNPLLIQDGHYFGNPHNRFVFFLDDNAGAVGANNGMGIGAERSRNICGRPFSAGMGADRCHGSQQKENLFHRRGLFVKAALF